MEIKILNECEVNNKIYGGHAGSKKGIVIDGNNYMVKFPKSTSNLENVNMSYTTSPLSEYIGSKIFSMCGIDTQEVILGIYDGKLVVACKDFLKFGEMLISYNGIKNDYDKKIEDSLGGGLKTDIKELEVVFSENRFLKSLPDFRKHFWNMFVIDSLILNNDRNSENYGIIYNVLDDSIRIAPVYDNGACLSPKVDNEKIIHILNDYVSFINSVYNSRTCSFTLNGENINPLKYIESMSNNELNEAIVRIVPLIDLDAIDRLIDEIPNSVHDILVMSEERRSLYKKYIRYIYENILLKVYEKLN